MTRIYAVSEGAVLPPRVAKVAVAQPVGFDVPDHLVGEMCARFGFSTVAPQPATTLLVEGVIEAKSVAATVSVSVEDPLPVPAPEEPEAEAQSEGDEAPRHPRGRRR
jgi:hypothetical protein